MLVVVAEICGASTVSGRRTGIGRVAVAVDDSLASLRFIATKKAREQTGGGELRVGRLPTVRWAFNEASQFSSKHAEYEPSKTKYLYNNKQEIVL